MRKTVILLSFFLLSCSNFSLHKDKFVISGTYLEVQSLDKRAAEVVYREFKRLDSIFNPYDKDSQVYKLNNNSGRKVEGPDELIEVIKKAKEYYRRTDGVFDITKGNLYQTWKKWGQSERSAELPDSAEIERLKAAGGIEDIKIGGGKTIRIEAEGVSLDLSGIAKGYMVDKAVTKLKQLGVKGALVNAGGDLYCLGENRASPWKVGIRGAGGSIVATIKVKDGAVATSGNYEQVYKKEGKNYSHIINPQTGYPVEKSFLGVTVVGKNCTEADILATAFFIKGKQFARKVIRDNPSITAYFVTESEVEKIN